ncbi:MAG TPA: phosphoglucosamine mutase, partial [bacterium]|nr:phosphoglucosamine mutase [bacterium]
MAISMKKMEKRRPARTARPAAVAAPKAAPKRKLFGTDGVRGVANVYPMTAEIALQLGRAAAHRFRRADAEAGHRHRILIGKDTRLSCYMFESALVAGICSMGVDAILVGPMPTPAIAYLTNSMRCDAGVVISASHNPFQDNGIKFFARDGFKLPDEVEAEIEELVFGDSIADLRPTADAIGKAYRVDDAEGRYISYLKETFPKGRTLDGLRIVLDCANGAAYKVAPAVFQELGAKVFTLGVTPNGENINAGVGALYPQKLQAAVLEHGADLGIALDGDADRVIFSDENGKIVDGDEVMAIVAGDWLKKRKLTKRTLVTTVMSNMGLDIAIRKKGGRVVRTAVGDRYVVEAMRE